jgi:hypothetical protein
MIFVIIILMQLSIEEISLEEQIGDIVQMH